MNQTKFMEGILREYAKVKKVSVRNLCDLSPLENYLMLQLRAYQAVFKQEYKKELNENVPSPRVQQSSVCEKPMQIPSTIENGQKEANGNKEESNQVITQEGSEAKEEKTEVPSEIHA